MDKNNLINDEFEDYLSVSNYYDNYRTTAGFNQLLGYIDQVIKDKKGSILEVGCGTGNYLSKLARIYERVCGLDLNKGMLDKCQEKVKDLKNTELKLGSALQIPFSDTSFDVIIAMQTVHHYGCDENRISFFKEARRVLKPGGRLIINYTEPHQQPYHYPILLGGPSCAKAVINDRRPEEYTMLAEKGGNFKFICNEICKETLVHDDQFWDISRYSDKNILKSDSSFAYCSEDQKDFVVNLCKSLDETEKKGFISVIKKLVDFYGLSSFIVFE